jgi:hypothetical protein
VVVTSTTGMGFAAAEPAVPDPTNAHLWRPVNPVFFPVDGLTGAKYHSVRAGERVMVTCRNVASIGEGPIDTLGTATTFLGVWHLRRVARGTRLRAGRLRRARRSREQHRHLRLAERQSDA